MVQTNKFLGSRKRDYTRKIKIFQGLSKKTRDTDSFDEMEVENSKKLEKMKELET
jgi:hypothetical protein